MATRSFHDRPKTAPVQLTGPVARQLPQVFGSPVSLVCAKPVLGVADVGPRNEPTPENLRDDGSGGDREVQLVAIDDRALIDEQIKEDDRNGERVILKRRYEMYCMSFSQSSRN